MNRFGSILMGLSLVFGIAASVNADTTVKDKAAQIALGKKLYFDVNLSANNNQSCATCHNPSAGGFIDDRPSVLTLVDAGWDEKVPPPVSQGSHLDLFGGRNTSSAAYAAFSPAFRFDEVAGLYVGGQFWDGREMGLAGQAAGPFRNPVEMAMLDKKAVVLKLKNDSEYVSLFNQAYETEDSVPFDLSAVDTLTNQGALEAYDLMAKAIGEFEKTRLFNKFNSKYDYFLDGKETLTADEEKGRKLFVKQGKCALCHISQVSIAPDGGTMPPLFTDFTYDNLGLPRNGFITLLTTDQVDPKPDLGLGGVLKDSLQDGKFKVMTLRNIEITAPYGHNGVFQTLEQIVHFYNTRDVLPPCTDTMDPGFGVSCWPAPEVPVNVNVAELGNLHLTAEQERQIVAFLKTLTDRDTDAFPTIFSEDLFPPMP